MAHKITFSVVYRNRVIVKLQTFTLFISMNKKLSGYFLDKRSRNVMVVKALASQIYGSSSIPAIFVMFFSSVKIEFHENCVRGQERCEETEMRATGGVKLCKAVVYNMSNKIQGTCWLLDSKTFSLH